MAGGNDQRRQAEIVHRPHEAGDADDGRLGIRPAADIALRDGRGGRARGRSDDHVDIADGGEMGGERRSAPAQRLQIFDGAIGEAVFQPRPHLRAVILRAVRAARAHGRRSPRLPARSGRRRRRRSDPADSTLTISAPSLAKSCKRRIERGGDIGLEIVDIEAFGTPIFRRCGERVGRRRIPGRRAARSPGRADRRRRSPP